MDTSYYLLFTLVIIATPLGIALAAIGGVVRLCEASWGKPAGCMASRGLLGAAGVALLPAAAFALLAVRSVRR